ncbi:MAG: PAS domain-containing protein [Flavobacterium sp.]
MVDDNNEFLENYARIVRLFGNTFKHMGIEILLHNLMNPSRSIVEIEGGEVTGRKSGLGTTSLVLDLKKRKALNEDKLNYELNIGSRKFKCTTVPIFRKDYGLIGAVCINIDVNFISDDVLKNEKILQDFFMNYSKTEMKLDENILSKDEYEKALKGKKHWKE